MPGGTEEAQPAEPEPPAQTDPTGRWTRTNQVLGKGACKIVYKAFDHEEGLEVAWNQIPLNELVTCKDDRDRVYAEIRVLNQLKHKNIMTFHGWWLENKGYTLNFITEYFTSGNLRQYRARHKNIDAEVMKRWAWQILCGLVYLHGHAPPIIHRDLKCDNIFINGSEGVVKIGDLGLATDLRPRPAPQSVIGTPEFMAPELYEELYDDRADVYAFGMVMLELYTLEYPYRECNNAAQIYRKVTTGVRPKALFKVMNSDLRDIIGRCINHSVEGRPRARQLLKHPYFDSIRNEKLALKLGQEALRGQDAIQTIPELPASNSITNPTNNGTSNGSSYEPGSTEGDSEEETTDTSQAPQAKHARGNSAAGEALEGVPHQWQTGSPTQDLQNVREFKVQGKLQEHDDKLHLRLRIFKPDGATKTVDFTFDLASDTAMSVASEMVEEMSLSHGDAHKIACAIKEEILSLTKQQDSRRDNLAPSTGSGSDEEGFSYSNDSLSRQESSGLKYEAAHCPRKSTAGASPQTEARVPVDMTVSVSDRINPDPPVKDVSVVEPQPHTPSDSVTSVHEHFSEASPPSNLTFATQGHTPPSGGQGYFSGTSRYPLSAPGSATSPAGSPPPGREREHAASEPPVSPSRTTARDQLASALPPRAMLKPSESLLRHLGRTDSANHAQDLEALHQALVDKAAGKFKDNDLTSQGEAFHLPLKKMLDSLEHPDCLPIPAPSHTSRTAPILSNSLPSASLDLQDSTRPLTAPAFNAQPLLVIPEFRRSGEAISRGASPASSSSKMMHEASSDFRSQPNLVNLVMPSTRSEGSLHNEPHRTKSRADLLEARRQAAQTSLKTMESNCLEGLDTFQLGPSKGRQQIPIRKMMGGSAHKIM